MKYNEIIHINENFVPVFDLENEEENYWSLFIPNDNFRHILRAVIDSLITTQKHPVWLQGTYGTGKSHATSVIKHLLCDETLSDSFDLEDEQLTAKLKSFRKKNKVFPIILKGTSTIGNSRRFTYTIQSAVKKALKENNMNISIQSEYENMINIIEDGIISIKEEYLKDTILEAFGKDEIISRLKNEESEILIELENIYMEKGISTVTQESIHNWLIEVKKELKNKYDIDYLMIFWDEFTGALNLPNVDEILLQVQDIAESKNKGISLFIVSHKTRTTQTNINQEHIEKVMDRFERINYTMEPIATYELMAKSIRREEGWEKEKNRFIEKLRPLIGQISENGPYKVNKALEELYPIHPYTAFLATFIAQYIGSTERSIFKFLHDDEEYGFKNFINTFDIDEKYFLTSDYLWDFFNEDFKQIDDDKIRNAIEKYNMYHHLLENKGIEYLIIFKVILLLNILFKMVELDGESLAIPSQENIFNIFLGSIYESKVETVLDYIDEQTIINKNPENIFELTTNSLPQEQISKEKNKLKQNLKLTKLLDDNQTKELKNSISNKLNRKTNIEFVDANIRENTLINKLNNKGHSAYLQLYLFFCLNSKEFDSIKKIIKSISEKGLLENKIMIVSKESFDNKLNKYLEYKASSIVANNHKYTERSEKDETYAKKIVEEWVNDIKQHYVDYYLNNKSETLLFNDLIKKINRQLSKQIFNKGLENLDATRNKALWDKKRAKVVSENYLTSKIYDELFQSLNSQNKQSTGILKDNDETIIVNQKLELNENVRENHPVKMLQDFVDEKFTEAQSTGNFNLGHVLKPLNDIPWGYYANIINIAAISFVLRKYINKLYESNGQPVNETKMRDKIMGLFEFWENGKETPDLIVRFGSENEKKLIELLNDIFNLKLDVELLSITNIRWSIRNWFKDKKTPLWIYEYANDINDESIYALQELNELLKPDDLNIPDELIQSCYSSLNSVHFDLKMIFKNYRNELFGQFIHNFDDEIERKDIPRIVDYIIEKMPEEVNNWEKDALVKEIYNWIKQNTIKSEPTTVSSQASEVVSSQASEVVSSETSEVVSSETSEVVSSQASEVVSSETSEVVSSETSEVVSSETSEVVSSETSTSIPIESEKIQFITKIKNMDAIQLKNILIKAIEEHHEIQTILDDYFEK